VLEKGVRSGAIRPSIDPNELRLTPNALCFFSIANRHTFEAQFGWQTSSPKARAQRRREIADLLWRHVRRG
jgi:tetracycline repressor-like protein